MPDNAGAYTHKIAHTNTRARYLQARALYAYDPLEDDELKLSADGELFVLGLAQPEWFVAVHAHRVPAEIGLVPENYVRILDQAEAFAEAFF